MFLRAVTGTCGFFSLNEPLPQFISFTIRWECGLKIVWRVWPQSAERRSTLTSWETWHRSFRVGVEQGHDRRVSVWGWIMNWTQSQCNQSEAATNYVQSLKSSSWITFNMFYRHFEVELEQKKSVFHRYGLFRIWIIVCQHVYRQTMFIKICHFQSEKHIHNE